MSSETLIRGTRNVHRPRMQGEMASAFFHLCRRFVFLCRHFFSYTFPSAEIFNFGEYPRPENHRQKFLLKEGLGIPYIVHGCYGYRTKAIDRRGEQWRFHVSGMVLENERLRLEHGLNTLSHHQQTSRFIASYPRYPNTNWQDVVLILWGQPSQNV